MIEPGNTLRWEASDEDDRITVYPNGNGPVLGQLLIMLEALAVYDKRNVKYKDNWRRFGWRGCLFRLRERVERAWDYWWDKPTISEDPPSNQDVDDLIDLINFAGFTIRAIREDNRDGSWW